MVTLAVVIGSDRSETQLPAVSKGPLTDPTFETVKILEKHS